MVHKNQEINERELLPSADIPLITTLLISSLQLGGICSYVFDLDFLYYLGCNLLNKNRFFFKLGTLNLRIFLLRVLGMLLSEYVASSDTNHQKYPIKIPTATLLSLLDISPKPLLYCFQ